MPPDALERLFEKFYRVSTAGGSPIRRGSGIGLAVVRGLAEASGARVGARRSDLGGLAIDLDLPVAAPAENVDTDAAPVTSAQVASVPAAEPR